MRSEYVGNDNKYKEKKFLPDVSHIDMFILYVDETLYVVLYVSKPVAVYVWKKKGNRNVVLCFYTYLLKVH